MKKAKLEVETYNNGKGTKIKYDPGDINPYTMIGIFEQMIQEIKTRNLITEKRNESNPND